VSTLPSRYPLSSVGLLACGVFVLAAVAQDAAPTRSVWDGVYTPDQATRGQALYNKECARCHGLSLSGGEEAPPLSGGAFLANWNGLTVGDLFERIRVSMPEGRPGTLGRQQNADILAYILTGNQFPPGKTELNKETELLKQIRFESARPEPKK
jgi:S-disulfanyl-L-cysteine oxidoreductase SoxD